MMRRTDYDVVIVGARCAGATLATYLSRAGASVLLLDRDVLPSDQVLSTHTVHPPGMDVLDEIGVGDGVREIAPPAQTMRLNKNGAILDIRYGEGRFEYCPRRERLDGLLQEAAVAAGAVLRDHTRVTSLVEENGRVCGVKALTGGLEQVYRAGLVVGADGRHSTIAKLAGATEYLAYDAPRGMYWAYWDRPFLWRNDSDYPFGMYVGHVGEGIRTIFQTDHGQLLMGSLPPAQETREWRADPLGALKADLAMDVFTGPLVAGTEPIGNVRGTVKERYFFRDATGPGWVLVGDAGHHKEFVIGDGITEALLQARSLAKAMAAGTDAALRCWWRQRDVEALPLYFFGKDEGALGPPSDLDCIVFSRVAEKAELRARMARVMEHQLSPYEVFPLVSVVGWTLGGVLRGKRHVLREFIATGRKGAQAGRELRFRRKLLAAEERKSANCAVKSATIMAASESDEQ